MVEGDKLLAIYKDGSTYSNCSSSIMTTLEFYCDRLAEWAFVEGDSHGVATDFFDSMFIDVENPCSVSYVDTSSTQLCGCLKGYHQL